MTTYRLLGRPISPPVPELTDVSVGELFDAALDGDLERWLLDGGAIAVEKPKKEPKPDSGHKVG